MKEYQIIKAYHTLKRMSQVQFPVREAYKLFKLTRELEPVFNARLEFEYDLVKKNGGTIDPVTGMPSFEKQEDYDAYREAMLPLAEEESSAEFTPVQISLDVLENVNMSPADIETLDGFVIFE